MDIMSLRSRYPEVAEEWFRTYVDPVYTFVYYRAGRDREIAVDVTQETFLGALRRIDQYDPSRGNMMAWLRGIARNCIRQAARHRVRENAALRLSDADSLPVNAPVDLHASLLPETVMEQRDMARRVHETMTALPDRYRRLLSLHYYERRSIRDIAHLHSSSEAAIKSLLHRARNAFRSAFQDQTEIIEDLRQSARGAS